VLNLREEENVQRQTTRVGQTEGGQEGEEGCVCVGHVLGGDHTMQPDVGGKSVVHLPMTSMRPKVITISPVIQAGSRSGKWVIRPVIQPSFCTSVGDNMGKEERSERIRMMEMELLRMDKEITWEKEVASRTTPNPVLHHEQTHVKKNDSKGKVELLLSMTQLLLSLLLSMTQLVILITPPLT
jgi:hypothetical protein